MRHSFERNIQGYNEVAAEKVNYQLTEQEERRLASELANKIKRAAAGRKTTADAQVDIYFIQEEKQRIMSKLKDRLELLHEEGFVPPRGDDEALVVMEGGEYVVKGEDGGRDEAITKGELLTDMEWGMYYYLDPATVDKKVMRRYLIEDAKRELMNKLDEQITIDETSSETTSEAVKAAYEGRAEQTGSENGTIAEKMVKNFLKKLTLDYSVDFSVQEADAHQDVHKKMDFIIRRKAHKRGVGVEEANVERVGVQFTVNTNADAQQRKIEQVKTAKEMLRPEDHIDDVVLVTVPSESVRGVYNRWNRDRRPGGPDKQWGMDTKEQIFRMVMQGILSPEEIDRDWDVISGASGSDALAQAA